MYGGATGSVILQDLQLGFVEIESAVNYYIGVYVV